MEEAAEEVTEKVDGRTTRKRSGPRRKRAVIHPSLAKRYSERNKKTWADNRETYMKAAAERRGKGGRAGVPDGMRKPEAEQAWADARASAKETITKMVENKVLSDDEKANEALEAALTIMRGPSTHQRDKLAAARTVLEWTKAKPASKAEVSIQKAEDWLAMVTADAAKEVS